VLLPEEDLPPEEDPEEDDPEEEVELPIVASFASMPESTAPPRPARQYLPPSGEVAHVSPEGQSALVVQS
jgi:hypothetical protein